MPSFTFPDGIVDAGFDIVKNHSTTVNSFCSPLSLFYCLLMVANGAQDTTLTEILQLLGSSHSQVNWTLDQLNSNAQELLTHFPSSTSSGYEMYIANSIWGQDLKPDYKSMMAKQFQASVLPLESKEKVNAWVSEATKGKIVSILDKINESDVLVINALYFKGKWKKPFKTHLTSDRAFYLTQEEQVPVKMMFMKAKFSYGEDPMLGQVLVLPYEVDTANQKPLEAVLVLPPKDSPTGLTDVTSNRLNEVHLRSTSVELSLPRFKIESTFKNLVPQLRKQGLHAMFDDRVANFSRMSDWPLFVSQVIQKVVIEVNEEGTVAAAVTAAVMTRSMMMPETAIMTCNRPFLFLIREPESGVVFFSGTVSHADHFN